MLFKTRNTQKTNENGSTQIVLKQRAKQVIYAGCILEIQDSVQYWP